MKLTKLLLAIVGATVLLAALVSSSSAARLSYSATTLNATFARMNFRGGFGTIECRIILNGALHSGSMTKTLLSLMGFVTAANVNGCSSGNATLLRETLPWHVRYDSFVGSLPAITSIATKVIGFPFRYSEPVFGIGCLLRSTAEQPLIYFLNRETGAGAISSAGVGGTIRCDFAVGGGGFNFTFEGMTTNAAEAGGARVTITLI